MASTNILSTDLIGNSRTTINDNFTAIDTELGLKEVASNKNAAEGYAGLTGGKISSSQLPAIALTNVTVVADQAAMLALTAQTGDVATRTDNSTSYMLSGTASVLADWKELVSPADAAAATHIGTTSGNPHAVTKTDIGLGNVANITATANDTDANLKARANHTGTQLLSTISDAGDAAAKNTGTTAGTLCAGDDSRLSDARAPTPHSNHTLSDITDAGTAAALNVAATGDAAAGEVVKGDDSRLSGGGGGAGDISILGSSVGVALGTTATPTIYTSATTNGELIHKLEVEVTGATSAAGNATVSLGTNATTYDNIIAPIQLTGLTTVGQVFTFNIEGISQKILNTEAVVLNITGDTGTLTATVRIYGKAL